MLSSDFISLLLHWLAVVFATVLFGSGAFAQSFTGKVVSVADGDTLTLLVAGKHTYKIRLSEIDAPEAGQPYGRASKRMLSDLAVGQEVNVRVVDVDRYKRSVGRVRMGSVDINAEMVKRGGAWAFRQYQSDQRFQLWEQEARTAKRGLWGLQADQIIAPWDWRADRRAKSVGREVAASVPDARSFTAPIRQSRSGFQCNTKSKCGQMGSCEEAMFHLIKCGVGRLDRDKDGVPCESICG